jgi:hypothetical protein
MPKTLHWAAVAIAALLPCVAAAARGVSPYLPLSTDPDMERKIERVLVLAGRPILRRPIAAAIVIDALPKACALDAVLCGQVRRYLQRYMHDAGVTLFRTEVAATERSNRVVPDAHGLTEGDNWDVAASAYYQPSDYLLLDVGGVAYPEHKVPTGSMLSVGFEFAQLDIGYRDHWFSPQTDSSMLMSTEAPTMPSVTVSNYEPMTRLGLQYEIFLAQMSRSDLIYFNGVPSSGNPRLSGLSVSMSPASGFAMGINRLLQYGGGARGGTGVKDFVKALFRPNSTNLPDAVGNREFGNQEASITATHDFNVGIPFAVHLEYAGEDNSYGGPYLLGKTDLTLGLDFPQLWHDFDFGYEVSEWQNTWYVHHLYGDGMTNDGDVISNWFGDNRVFGDAVGGISHMLRIGWEPGFGGYMQLRYRTLANDFYSAEPYRHLQELTLRYGSEWHGHSVGVELGGGRDVLGHSFLRLAASADLVNSSPLVESGFAGSAPERDADLFVDVGVSSAHVHEIVRDDGPNNFGDRSTNPHFGFGVRKPVSAHSDLGVRLEFDTLHGTPVDGRQLLSVRLADYRYRLNDHLAFGGFFGAGRYDLKLPAYGYYYGAGVQWLDVLPKWDLGLDYHHYEKLARDKLIATDPYPGQSNGQIYVDVDAAALYLSRRL